MVTVLAVTISVSMSMVLVTAALSVARHILIVVPIIPHKVDGPAACVVLPAVLVPVLLMSRWHVQIDRLRCDVLRGSGDHDRLRIDNRRSRNIANIDLAIEPRLAEADGDTDITRERRDGTDTKQCGKQKRFHGHLLTLCPQL